MEFTALLFLFDLLGTFVFAMSGSIAGIEKKMDIFGVYMLALVTATGGGILRTLLIGNAPPLIFRDSSYLIVCTVATLVVFYLRHQIMKRQRSLLFFDAFGLGIFLSIGVTVALQAGLSYWASILMGVITAAFGGVIRDVLSNKIPLIFQKELYATVCLAGGIVYILLLGLNTPKELIIVASSAFVFAFRLLAMKYNLQLPK